MAFRRRSAVALARDNARLAARLRAVCGEAAALRAQLADAVVRRTALLQAATERLAELSLTDDVTGLFNQRFLHPRLAVEFERAEEADAALAVIVLDLDRFKTVNDTRDHLFGSRVLRRIAAVLRRGVRADDMVVRYGGDEFVVLMPRARMQDAVRVGERLRALVESTDVGDPGDAWYATVSVGVAAREVSRPSSARALLRAADHALLGAKARGRNRLALAGREARVAPG